MSEYSLPKRVNPIYGNCKMLAPDGTLLCRCHQEKVDWYVSRGLADIESTEPFVTIRLKFQPKGMGNSAEPFYLSDKHNRCVVCGREDNLTQHHCVPRCFRKNFPPEYKYHTSHDVLPLCVPCHTSYEPSAYTLKKQLAQQLGLTLGANAPAPKGLSQVLRHANALYRHSDKIPEARRQELYQTLRDYYQKEDITQEDIEEACDLEGNHSTPAEDEISKLVVEKTEDLDAFVVMWRQHFVSTVHPRFLPEHWSVDYDTKRVG